MPTITLSVPEDLKKKMSSFDEINWSAFVRNQIEEKTREIIQLQELKKQLKEEQEAQEFAVQLQRKGRTGRLKELKNKGLI
ncbi:MAG: hypothetical protein ACMXYD_04705 [Candidatus Woesearchaeota archaeon]